MNTGSSTPTTKNANSVPPEANDQKTLLEAVTEWFVGSQPTCVGGGGLLASGLHVCVQTTCPRLGRIGLRVCGTLLSPTPCLKWRHPLDVRPCSPGTPSVAHKPQPQTVYRQPERFTPRHMMYAVRVWFRNGGANSAIDYGRANKQLCRVKNVRRKLRTKTIVQAVCAASAPTSLLSNWSNDYLGLELKGFVVHQSFFANQ